MNLAEGWDTAAVAIGALAGACFAAQALTSIVRYWRERPMRDAELRRQWTAYCERQGAEDVRRAGEATASLEADGYTEPPYPHGRRPKVARRRPTAAHYADLADLLGHTIEDPNV